MTDSSGFDLSKFTEIRGSRISVRCFKRSDADDLRKAANHRDVARYLPHMPHPYALQQASDWIRKAHRFYRKGSGLLLGITENSTGAVVGTCDLFNLSATDRLAEIGYWIGRDHWRKGFTIEAVTHVLDFAFRQLTLHRVYAITSALNIGSIGVLTKAGFVHEGTWRKCTKRGNRYVDALGFGLLKSEFAGPEKILHGR